MEITDAMVDLWILLLNMFKIMVFQQKMIIHILQEMEHVKLINQLLKKTDVLTLKLTHQTIQEREPLKILLVLLKTKDQLLSLLLLTIHGNHTNQVFLNHQTLDLTME